MNVWVDFNLITYTQWQPEPFICDVYRDTVSNNTSERRDSVVPSEITIARVEALFVTTSELIDLCLRFSCEQVSSSSV